MPEGIFGPFRLTQHRDRMPVEVLACIGHSEVARCPIEQTYAETILELLDAVTERRFGSPQRPACGREATPVDHVYEQREMIQIQHGPPPASASSTQSVPL